MSYNNITIIYFHLNNILIIILNNLIITFKLQYLNNRSMYKIVPTIKIITVKNKKNLFSKYIFKSNKTLAS